LKRFAHLPRRQCVNTSATICPHHRKARIFNAEFLTQSRGPRAGTTMDENAGATGRD
jgi:hypothetical protein